MVLYVGMLSGLSLWILLLVLAGTGVDHVVGLQCNKWDTKNRHKWLKLDFLPAPFNPTRAIFSPGLMVRSRFFRVGSLAPSY